MPRGLTLSLSLVLALPLARGLYRLGTPNVWIDEAATWWGITGSWERLFAHAKAGDDCGGFAYAAVMKGWTAVAGTTEAALRLPSVVFTALLGLTVFAVGRRLWGRAAGSYAGLVVALYPVVFLQSRQARCYALGLLLYALALLGLVLFLQGRRRAGGALLAAAGSVLVVTHVFGVFALAGVGAVAALAPLVPRGPEGAGERAAPGLGRRLLVHLAPFGPPLLLLALWMLVLWARVEQNLESFWIRLPLWRAYAGLVEYVLPVAAAALVLWRERGRPGHRFQAAAAALLALPILLGPLAASLATQGPHHFVLERYFLSLAVLGALGLGYLLARAPRAVAWPAAAAILLAALLKPGIADAYSEGAPLGTLSQDAADYLREHRAPDEPVFVAPGSERLTLAYYGIDGLPGGEWGCEELPERLEALRSGAGAEPRGAWVAHFGCPPERVSPPFTRVVGRRHFGPLKIVELEVAAAEPGREAPPAGGGR